MNVKNFMVLKLVYKNSVKMKHVKKVKKKTLCNKKTEGI